ncbi:MAG: HAD family hydrolase [Myxococcota bacterium]
MGLSPTGFELVIFDCDGVLVDSEAIACRVEAELLTAAGFPHAFEDVRRDYLGRSSDTILRMIEERFGRRLPDDMKARSQAVVLEAFERELRPIEGVEQAIAALAGPRCVASSSDPARIRRSLELTGLLAFFDPHLFSAAMVASGKPAPDLFLLAAREMGAEPEGCVVIEDSVPGVIAGRAAGMRVLGFHGGGHCDPGHAQRLVDAGAHAVFDDMRALPAELVAALSGGGARSGPSRRAGC